MRVCIDFPDDQPYLDLPTEKIGIKVRIWPNTLPDGTWNIKSMDNIDADWNMDQLFKVNERITGLFYVERWRADEVINNNK